MVAYSLFLECYIPGDEDPVLPDILSDGNTRGNKTDVYTK